MKNPAGKFLTWVLFLTWVFWIPAGFLHRNDFPMYVTVFHYVGGAVPFLLTVVFLYMGPKEDRKDFIKRLVDIRRISKTWWFVIFC